ncbi:DUF1778 domain-containing protein [Pseudomonas sp. NPDC008258]|uniref:type II toxin-antitoxin system TacA family antitoxin n=1 Tax=Pseudomonas sp. NPDC008258 TaxID=3364418 RepID=UPI0036E2EAF2
MSFRTKKREHPVSIHMRVGTIQRDLIDAAVDLMGTDRSSFILDAACKRAEEVLIERQLFLLDDEAFDRFEQALEQNALKDNKCLQVLISKPVLWS